MLSGNASVMSLHGSGIVSRHLLPEIQVPAWVSRRLHKANEQDALTQTLLAASRRLACCTKRRSNLSEVKLSSDHGTPMAIHGTPIAWQSFPSVPRRHSPDIVIVLLCRPRCGVMGPWTKDHSQHDHVWATPCQT